MDAQTVREKTIKPKLIEMVGNSIASALITVATVEGAGGASEQEKLRLTVNSICADPRVLGMWGNAQTEKQKKEWLALV